MNFTLMHYSFTTDENFDNQHLMEKFDLLIQLEFRYDM